MPTAKTTNGTSVRVSDEAHAKITQMRDRFSGRVSVSSIIEAAIQHLAGMNRQEQAAVLFPEPAPKRRREPVTT